MNVCLPLSFLIFSTLFGGCLTLHLLRKLKSAPLMLTISWFVGQYVCAFLIYYASTLLVQLGYSHVLFKATILCSSVVILLSMVLFRETISKAVRSLVELLRQHATLTDLLACIAAFSFAFYFFLSQLRTDDGVIKAALIYWDFPVHAPIIQGFSQGDNFPAQNNSLAGIPLTYHFFFDFLISIYAALGLDLVGGINAVSVIAFGMLLACMFGFASEFLCSRSAGFLAMLLAITTGSLRFIYDIKTVLKDSFSDWLLSIAHHPYYVALLPNNVAGYNGNMFNIFYFLAERQMIFASIFLLVAMVVLHHRSSFSLVTLVGIGLAAGWFMQWHLFVTIAVLMMVGGTFVLGKHRLASGGLFLGMSCVIGLLAFEMREFTRSDLFFPDIQDYPRFNPEFATMDPLNPVTGYPLTPRNFAWYYLFAYGIKLFLIPLALWRLWKHERELAIIFISLALPTFVAINTVQLSPLSVYDNHKWLRPLNITFDLLVAWLIVTEFFPCRGFTRRALGALVIIACTIGGAVELYPYLLRVKGTQREKEYSPRRTPLTALVEAKTPQQAVFLSANTLEIHLAGRLTFFSNPSDEVGATGITISFRINESGRGLVRASIYNATSIQELCQAAQSHKINYVELSASSPAILAYPPSAKWPLISATNRHGDLISFIDIAALCAPGATFDETRPTANNSALVRPPKTRRKVITLTSLTPLKTDAGVAEPMINRSFNGQPLTMAGKKYHEGLGLHAPIKLTYAVPRWANFFSGIVGLDDEIAVCSLHSAVVRFIDGHGKIIFNSGLIVSHKDPKPFIVDVRKKNEITISITDSGDGTECDHVDIADAVFTKGFPSNARR